MLSAGRSLRRKFPYQWICESCRKKTIASSFSSTSHTGASALRKLPNGPARTRFAPSPTGYLHLGSLRTALFNYLLAKSTGGQFLLRIEDTDQKRTVPDAEERLFQDLKWAGLQWDEGPQIGGPFGPYKQSQRTALYREHATKLLHSGHAYRCFCSPYRLHALAKKRTELGLPADYDGHCRHVTALESESRSAEGYAHVIRFKAPSTYPAFKDLVYGTIQHRSDHSQKAQLYPAVEDPILLKSDGFPTYHLANVVDDHHMKITHVVRGAEWMSSTNKHLAMYDAFGWQAPAFAHVGLLLDENRQKLSKRNLDLDVSSYRDKNGIFPEVLTNFVALLGWSHGQKKDIMDLQQLVDIFDMKFTKGGTVVTFEKLWYLQRAHAERYAAAVSTGNDTKAILMSKPIMDELNRLDLVDNHGLIMGRHEAKTYILKLLQADARNYTNAPAFVERNKYFFRRPDQPSLSSSRPPLVLRGASNEVEDIQVSAEGLIRALSSLEFLSEKPDDWMSGNISACVNNIITENAKNSLDKLRNKAQNIELLRTIMTKSWSKTIHQYVRWALTASMPGPNGAETMEMLGGLETIRRLQLAAEVLASEQAREGGGLDIGSEAQQPT